MIPLAELTASSTLKLLPKCKFRAVPLCSSDLGFVLRVGAKQKLDREMVLRTSIQGSDVSTIAL